MNPVTTLNKLFLIGLFVLFTFRPATAQTTLFAEISEPAPDTTIVNLVALDFTGIISMQFSFHYNADKLTFSAGYLTLPGSLPPEVVNPSPGAVILAWLSPDIINGTTRSGCTNIATLVFTGSGTTPDEFEFSGNPIPIEFTDPNGFVNPVFSIGSCTTSSLASPPPPDFKIAVSPNPFSSEARLDIHGLDMGTAELRLFDLQGQEVFRKTISGPETYLSAENLLPGTYFCAVFQKGVLRAKEKIRIQ
ncbi:MAG: T9SS type A sorting domain-containing protein [Lewinellaceae bacterium]|nr:T9SS type A sorting domain-containing protein [Lewinellaceae bacterium]